MGNDSEVSDFENVTSPSTSEQKPSTAIMQKLRSLFFTLWAVLGLDLPTVLMMAKLATKFILPPESGQLTIVQGRTTSNSRNGYVGLQCLFYAFILTTC
jgi:hypothetical protein